MHGNDAFGVAGLFLNCISDCHTTGSTFVLMMPHVRFAAQVGGANGIGTRHALLIDNAAARMSERFTQRGEVRIRTLSVSLVAVAAIAASLLIVRSRDDLEPTGLLPAGENAPVRLKLDALREAGL